MLNKKNLVDYFFEGIKSKEQLKIGVEHEKFILNRDTLKPVSYDEKGGIKNIFESLINLGWKPIFEGSEKKIIALSRGLEFITLEPGGQIELSGQPFKNIHQNCTENSNHLNELKSLSKEHNFILLGMGVEPNLSIHEFPWIPKNRYSIMKKYMPKVGKLGHHMMQRSCTSQVNFDYFSEQDMIKKFRVLLNYESISTAMFANSPFDQGKPSKYLSLRSHFWHHTDKNRTGIIPFVFKQDFNFESYTNYALNIPMYFIKRNNKYINMTNFTFYDFLKGDNINGKEIGEPKIQDWVDHLSTLFPQVRLKQFLEVRSIDACSWDVICSPAAFWTGILYDGQSLDEALILMEDWTDEERLFLNLNVPQTGLNTKIKNTNVLEISKKLLDISYNGLKRRNIMSSNKKYDETYYLTNLKDNIHKGISPADILLDKYYNKWNQSTKPIYDHLIF
ncbi:glutamate--cysteine ligase [Alphaproteobacteria bacterium]|nr:glutamate--cysteine ligase [Alphaproteobacteria bacterium]